MSEITLHLGDCLDILPTLPAQSVEAIITDLPYGTTACKWDEIIPFAPMWEQVKRVLKPRGVFVTTASQPFTSKLVMSNAGWFKYEWVWDKVTGTDAFNAKKRPLKSHENILVFSVNGHQYNPQMTEANKRNMRNRQKHYFKGSDGGVYGKLFPFVTDKDEAQRYPVSVFRYSNQNAELHKDKRLHPTQKPVALYEYLIRTYTNEGDTVLDICAGSGTTGVAAMNTGRNAILIEKEPKYFEIAKRRIAEAQPCLTS